MKKKETKKYTTKQYYLL